MNVQVNRLKGHVFSDLYLQLLLRRQLTAYVRVTRLKMISSSNEGSTFYNTEITSILTQCCILVIIKGIPNEHVI